MVGLGNPGPRYAGTRHNVGQVVLDELADGASFTRRNQAEVCDTRLGTLPGGAPGPRVVLARPTVFMNLSGGPVSGLLKYLSVPASRLVVVHDDIELDLGQVRLKPGGGEGGHNGLRSISTSLSSRNYLRVRCGIGRPPGRQDPADYVLSGFARAEQVDVEILVADAADAVRALVTEGPEAARSGLPGAG